MSGKWAWGSGTDIGGGLYFASGRTLTNDYLVTEAEGVSVMADEQERHNAARFRPARPTEGRPGTPPQAMAEMVNAANALAAFQRQQAANRGDAVTGAPAGRNRGGRRRLTRRLLEGRRRRQTHGDRCRGQRAEGVTGEVNGGPVLPRLGLRPHTSVPRSRVRARRAIGHRILETFRRTSSGRAAAVHAESLADGIHLQSNRRHIFSVGPGEGAPAERGTRLLSRLRGRMRKSRTRSPRRGRCPAPLAN